MDGFTKIKPGYERSLSNNSHLILSHTFRPGEYPLLIANQNDINRLNMTVIQSGGSPVDPDLKNQVIEALVRQKDQKGASDVGKVYLMLPTLLLKPLEESLEGLVVIKHVMYKFPHVSVSSLYERSTSERLEEAVGDFFDIQTRLRTAVDTINQRGLTGWVERIVVDLFDTVGLLGLSLVNLRLVADDIKTVELKENLLKLKKTTAFRTVNRH